MTPVNVQVCSQFIQIGRRFIIKLKSFIASSWMKETLFKSKETVNVFGNNAEEEKSDLMQLQEEAKQSTFSVFYLLLKDNETSAIKFTMVLIIEYLQLLSFSFDESIADQWKSDSIISYFTQFLSTFRVVYWFKSLSWDIYIIIFYVCVFLVFLIIIDFLYVALSFRMKKLTFMQPVQILRSACTFVVSILFIPFTELFLSLSACTTNPASKTESAITPGEYIHVNFANVTCFQSIHVVHVAISYILLILFCTMAFLSALLFFENRYSRNPTSKINADSDLALLISKGLYVFSFTLFSESQYAIFKSLVLIVFSFFCFYSFSTNRPFNSPQAQLTVEIFSGIFAWTNLILLITQILADTQFRGALQILFLGVPIISMLIYTRHENRFKLLMTSEKRIPTGDLCRKKNFFYFFIIDTREMSRKSGIILKGYVNHHTEVCPYDTCPIKAFKRLMMKEKLTTMIDRKKWASSDSKSLHADNNSLLLAQARALYRNGMLKFTKYVQLRIDYANFLLARMKDRKGALTELDTVEKNRLSFEQQFQVFRLRRIVEDELTEGHENGGIDFIAAMNFESTFKQFKGLVEKSAMLHFEFWNHLQDDSPDLVRLSMQGAKINTSILGVEDNWKKLSRLSSNAPKAIKLYASYLIEVLNDKETGNEQMIKAKEAANMRTNFDFGGAGGIKSDNDVNSYAQDGTPCVYISGETDRLGIVNQCNMSLCKIFGYMRKEDILNKNIKILQPLIYSEHHDKFLKESIQKAPDSISSRERQIFGKHHSGYIIPLWLQIKNLPSLLSGRQFVATFKVEKNGINKMAAYLIFNRQFELLDISTACLMMLGISQEALTKKQVYFDIPSLFPNLQTDSQLASKVGSQLIYHYPMTIDFNAKKDESQESFRGRGPRRDNTQENFAKQRADTTGDNNTQDGGMGGDENIDENDEENGEYNYDRMTTLNQQKSIRSNTKTAKALANILLKKVDPDDEDDDGSNEVKYVYRAIASSKKVIFQGNLFELNFDMLGFQAGYYLRIETINNNQSSNQVLNRVQVDKRIQQQTFQFSYDPIFKRFTRELRDQENKNFHVDKHYLDLKVKKEESKIENPANPNAYRYATMSYINFLNRQQRMIERGQEFDDFEDDDDGQSEDESQVSGDSNTNRKSLTKGKDDDGFTKLGNLPQTQQKLGTNATGPVDFKKILVAQEGFGREFLKNEIERLIRLLQEKQMSGEGVRTFVRSDIARKGWEEDNTQKAGLFGDRGGDIEKVHDDEDEDAGVVEKSSEKSAESDALKANIKSKKAFSMAINDKTMPPAIKRLSTAAQILIMGMIAIAIIEYAIIYKQFADIKSNFQLIQSSYLRTAELQKVAYNTRSMILMAEGLLTNYAGYATQDEFVTYIKSEFSSSLDLIYSIQNEINLSQLPLSPEHDQLLNNKTVTLYFKENTNSMKALMFSLTESILQISSTIFTISNMQVKDFSEINEDVFFLMYNTFNEFYMGLRKSSEYYIKELAERTDQREEISLVLFILAILTLFISFLILIPVVNSVNQQKDRVLSLFCEIDNSVLRVLGLRCEKFINTMQAEEGSDEIESNQDMEEALPAEEDADEYGLVSGSNQRMKKAKGNTKTESGFFFKFFVALCVIFAYYLQNYLLNTDAANAAKIMSNELNSTSITEPFYWFALNTQREMLYNKDRVITNLPSIKVAASTIYQLYDQQNDLQKSHLDNQNTLSTDYLDEYDSLMQQDLCSKFSYFKNSTNSTQACANFISGSLNQGLHVVIIRYFETLRNNLNLYQLNKAINTTVTTAANSSQSNTSGTTNGTSTNGTTTGGNKTNNATSGGSTSSNTTASNASSTNSTSNAPVTNANAIKAMFNLDSYYELYVVQNFVSQKFMRELVSTLSQTIQDDFSFRTQRKIAIFIVFVIVVLISFIIFWLPFLNGLNLQIYKTKLMLMIIPLEVLLKIKNVGKVLQSQNFISQTQKKGGSSGGSKRKNSDST